MSESKVELPLTLNVDLRVVSFVTSRLDEAIKLSPTSNIAVTESLLAFIYILEPVLFAGLKCNESSVIVITSELFAVKNNVSKSVLFF